MDNDTLTSAMVRQVKTGRGKRLAIMVAALLVVASIIAVVVFGFRGRQIEQNAAAITAPATDPAKAGWRPWWLQ